MPGRQNLLGRFLDARASAKRSTATPMARCTSNPPQAGLGGSVSAGASEASLARGVRRRAAATLEVAMAVPTDSFDLGALRLSSGEGRRLELFTAVQPLLLSDERYGVEPPQLPVVLDVSRMTGGGYALRLRFAVRLSGPCMRCLEPAGLEIEVDAREVHQPGGGEELESPYVDHQDLDLGAWARDALVLAAPAQILCRPDCAGLCPQCGIDLNRAGPTHEHDREPDPRWAKLRELR